MEIVQYKLADEKRKRRLRQLSRVAAPEDLRGELAAARLLTQESLEQGNIPLSNLLLNTVGKLAHSQTVLKRLNEEYLDREVVRRLVGQLCEIVTRTLEAHAVPGREGIVDQIASALTAKVEEPSKEVTSE